MLVYFQAAFFMYSRNLNENLNKSDILLFAIFILTVW